MFWVSLLSRRVAVGFIRTGRDQIRPFGALRALSKMGDLAVHLLSVVDETEEIHDLTSKEVVERESNVLKDLPQPDSR